MSERYCRILVSKLSLRRDKPAGGGLINNSGFRDDRDELQVDQRRDNPVVDLHLPRRKHNLTIRTFMKRFNRLSLSFSKKLENLEAACAMLIAYYTTAGVPGCPRTAACTGCPLQCPLASCGTCGALKRCTRTSWRLRDSGPVALAGLFVRGLGTASAYEKGMARRQQSNGCTVFTIIGGFALLPVLYVLSIGPAAYMFYGHWYGPGFGHVYLTVYRPLLFVADHYEWARETLHWYIHLRIWPAILGLATPNL